MQQRPEVGKGWGEFLRSYVDKDENKGNGNERLLWLRKQVAMMAESGRKKKRTPRMIIQIPTGEAVILLMITRSKKRGPPMNQRTDDASINISKAPRLRRLRKWLNAALGSVAVFLVTALIAIPPALAQNVPICDALTLYGNAVQQGLCQSLSPTTQNLWVCSLTNTNPDIHTTFNTNTDLHFTVRTPPAYPTCEGSSYLTGTWNAQQRQLNFQANQPQQVCNVNLASYLTRLNTLAPNNGCQQAFINAQGAGRITPSVAQSYINQCNVNHCP